MFSSLFGLGILGRPISDILHVSYFGYKGYMIMISIDAVVKAM